MIDIDALIGAGLLDYRGGRIEWTNPTSGKANSLRYLLRPTDVPTCLYLYVFYSNTRGEIEFEPITLLSKPQHFGGVRWHFVCPRWCKRWVRKLYFLTGKWFGCRTCHKLSYRSVQEHDSRLDVLRRNPLIFNATLRAGWKPAIRLAMRNLFQWQPESTVTITLAFTDRG